MKVIMDHDGWGFETEIAHYEHDSHYGKTERRTFRVCGTGHDLPDDPGQYVATFQMHGGALVFHVFEANARNQGLAPQGERHD